MPLKQSSWRRLVKYPLLILLYFFGSFSIRCISKFAKFLRLCSLSIQSHAPIDLAAVCASSSCSIRHISILTLSLSITLCLNLTPTVSLTRSWPVVGIRGIEIRWNERMTHCSSVRSASGVCDLYLARMVLYHVLNKNVLKNSDRPITKFISDAYSRHCSSAADKLWWCFYQQWLAVHLYIYFRNVKRRSDFLISNYMFKFGVVTLDTHFHLALTSEVKHCWHVIDWDWGMILWFIADHCTYLSLNLVDLSDWLHTRWFTNHKLVTNASTNQAPHSRESNLQPFDHKSSGVTLSSHPRLN